MPETLNFLFLIVIYQYVHTKVAHKLDFVKIQTNREMQNTISHFYADLSEYKQKPLAQKFVFNILLTRLAIFQCGAYKSFNEFDSVRDFCA